MYSFFFCKLEKFSYKINLKERFTAAYCNTAVWLSVFSPIILIHICLVECILCRNGKFRIIKAPSFGIMAIFATHIATLQKEYVSYARSVNKTKSFNAVNFTVQFQQILYKLIITFCRGRFLK